MLRIAICDDDKILVTQIEEMLNRYLDKKMIDRYIEIFYDGASLERIYEKGDRFDIIYLDIEMSGKNGIEAAKSIRRLDRDVLLIYVSSYETYFMQLFEVEPFRFIKKPIKETEFEEVIDFAYERIIEEDAYFEYKYNKTVGKVLIRKIMYFESAGKVKQYTIWMLYFLLDTAISMNFKFVGVISMLYSFIILIIFCAVLYREDIKYITLTVLFIICIGAASELIVALGIRAFLNSSQLQQFSLFGSTCSKLIILIIVRIVKLFRVSGIKRLDYMNWLANVSMTAGSLYIVYNLYLLSLNETKLLGSTMSSIIILLLNVICFKMFDKIAADAEIKRKNDIYKQSIDIYKREMEEREEHNEKLRRFRHDIKNHLIAIEKLALSKEYVRLRDYIHQLTDEKGVLQVTTISGNALIDGLLADKFDVARKYEIAVEYHIEIPTKLPFDDADLCIIVGNALDNAIDGTKDIEGAKKIEISMGVKQGNFLLKVKNTFNPELIKFDNNGKRLRTSKTDKSNHGMGIGLIEETALKYNGLMEITMNENIFCLSVLLYQN